MRELAVNGGKRARGMEGGRKVQKKVKKFVYEKEDRTTRILGL